MSQKIQRFELLGICGVYCGACTTFRAYNDADKELIDWEIKMGMPRDEIICKGCRSGFVNKWCSQCKFRKCVKNKGVDNCFECQLFPCKKLVDFSKTRAHRQLGRRNLVQLKGGNFEEWLRQQENDGFALHAEKSCTGTLKTVQIVEQDSSTPMMKQQDSINLNTIYSTLSFRENLRP